MLKNIRALREEAGISQRQLGEAIGLTQQSINQYENHNIEPDIKTLIAIADYFNTSVDYVVGHTDERRPVERVYPYELNEAESQLLDGYRTLSAKKRSSINQIIENYHET